VADGPPADDATSDFYMGLILRGDNTLSVEGGNLDVAGDIEVAGRYRDSGNNSGASGQVLSSIGAGTKWVAAGSGPAGPQGVPKVIQNRFQLLLQEVLRGLGVAVLAVQVPVWELSVS